MKSNTNVRTANAIIRESKEKTYVSMTLEFISDCVRFEVVGNVEGIRRLVAIGASVFNSTTALVFTRSSSDSEPSSINEMYATGEFELWKLISLIGFAISGLNFCAVTSMRFDCKILNWMFVAAHILRKRMIPLNMSKHFWHTLFGILSSLRIWKWSRNSIESTAAIYNDKNNN